MPPTPRIAIRAFADRRLSLVGIGAKSAEVVRLTFQGCSGPLVRGVVDKAVRGAQPIENPCRMRGFDVQRVDGARLTPHFEQPQQCIGFARAVPQLKHLRLAVDKDVVSVAAPTHRRR